MTISIPISSPGQPDVSKAGVDRRRAAREYRLQDRARALFGPERGNRLVGESLGVTTDEARRLIATGQARARALGGMRPHPDPESLGLTDPERLLLGAILAVQVGQWRRRETSSPKTDAVSWAAKRSDSWAVSCARRRLDRQAGALADQPALVSPSSNGYISLTDLGMSVAAALFPEAIPEEVMPS